MAIAAVIAMSSGIGPTVPAQTYPTKVVRLISPFAPGGTNDYLSRVVASRLERSFGRPVIVENRAGANGTIGAEFVAKRAGEPHVLLMGNSSTHGANVSLFPMVGYDPLADFTPIAMVGVAPIVLIVDAALPVTSVQELVAYARARPGTLNFGSSGNGSSGHLAGETFKSLAGIDMVHIPYRGDSAAVTDVIGGQIPIAFVGSAPAVALVAGGRVRALAVAHATRLPSLQGVPTMDQAGFEGMHFAQWFAIMAPAGIPDEVAAVLHAEIVATVTSSELRGDFARRGIAPMTFTPHQLVAFIRAEIARYAALIAALRMDRR